ncbi:MAG: hypothetical protein P1P84_05245 [Deferrisomatales bacterium]|nr:hypothetical protein [Deferrisomatales bacterium]
MLFLRCREIGAWIFLLAAATGAVASPDGEATAVRQRFSAAPVWLVGERHRVAAGHDLFGALVAQTLKAGERVQVGLELPADRQPALDAVLAGGAGVVAPVVIDCPSYRGLLTRLGELTAEYPGRLVVRAIDAPSGPSQERDRHMAEALGRMQAGGQRVLALVGNLHALKAAPGREGAVPTRLAARLEAAGVQVASLLQLGPGRAPPGQRSEVLVATAGPATAALRGLARLVEGSGAFDARLPGRAADAVILRP